MFDLIRKWFKSLKKWLINEVQVRSLKVGDRTIVISSDYIDFAALTADPTLAAGRVWFRSDLETMRYSPDGTEIVDFPFIPTFGLVGQNITYPAGSTYTPTVSGILSFYLTISGSTFYTQIYDGVEWQYAVAYGKWDRGVTLLTDGANIQFYTPSGYVAPTFGLVTYRAPKDLSYVNGELAAGAALTLTEKGFYTTKNAADVELQVYDGTAWKGAYFGPGLMACYGENMRLYNSATSPARYAYIKSKW